MSAGKKKGMAKMSAHMGPNMTPMVDIVMCILIFFMLGSSFAVADLFLQSNMATDGKGIGTEASEKVLPKAKSRIELQRRTDGKTVVYAFGEMKEDLNEDLLGLLQRKKGESSADIQLIIWPEAGVPWQDVVTVYDQCMKAKFANVAFAQEKR